MNNKKFRCEMEFNVHQENHYTTPDNFGDGYGDGDGDNFGDGYGNEDWYGDDLKGSGSFIIEEDEVANDEE